MRFMMLVKSAENAGMPPKELMDAIGQLAGDAMKSGAMIMTGGLLPTAASTSVRLRGGKVAAIDGPFTESKEVVGGFAIFEFKSKAEAVESAMQFMDLHKRLWPGWEGACEVRQLYGPDEFPPCADSGAPELAAAAGRWCDR